MAYSHVDLESIHQYSTRNRERLEGSSQAGCYYCLATFPPIEIGNWVDLPHDDKGDQREVTALCPRCGVDAVLPDNMPGVQLTAELLKAMRKHRFGE